MSYIVSLIIGIVAFLFFSSRTQKSQDGTYIKKSQELDTKITDDKKAVADAQTTADEAVKKYEEELRDYSKSDPDNKPGSS